MLWTLTLGVLFLPFLLVPERLGRFVPRFWTGGIIALARVLCGIRARVEGAEHLARGGALYAMKHQSAFETLYLWRIMPQPVFVLKRELLRIPVVGWYLARTPIIAINRAAGREALPQLLAQARAHLAAGRQVVIFPEGTRVPPGEKKPYKSGVFALYRETGLPVVPVALNSGLFWGRNAFLKRPGTVTFRFLPAIPPGLEREEFMRLLAERIERASLELP
jgi:1-acyl-sn-glycerol-3-phosphate acyltransferase